MQCSSGALQVIFFLFFFKGQKKKHKEQDEEEEEEEEAVVWLPHPFPHILTQPDESGAVASFRVCINTADSKPPSMRIPRPRLSTHPR